VQKAPVISMAHGIARGHIYRPDGRPAVPVVQDGLIRVALADGADRAPAAHRKREDPVIGVLIVEDELLTYEALVEYLGRLPGFAVAGHARTGVDALHRLAVNAVDLVLLDIYLPDINGLELLRRVRGAGNTVDIIVVTRARELAVVQAAMSYGVMQYLVKPFTFNCMRHRLERYQTYRARRTDESLIVAQQDIDHLLGLFKVSGEAAALPKGISRESLRAVVAAVRTHLGGAEVSAAEVATVLGASRITARRYLEYLVESGLMRRGARYHGTGRPKLEYAWLEPDDPEPESRDWP
jgi:response regulator of citrate/malate metabolism